MITLHSYRHDDIALDAALARLAGHTLQGYAITPAAFLFARADSGQLQTATPHDVSQIYEARLFNHQVELRWYRDPALVGHGTAVWLAEQPLDLNDWTPATLTRLEALDDIHRLMSGTLAGPHPELAGWQQMDAPRHGKVALPIPSASPQQRPAWRVREYLGAAPGSAGADGNLMVVEERLLGIETVEQ